MSLRALVRNTLDNNELAQAKELFEQTSFSAFLQHPEYDKVAGKNALHVLVFDEFASLKGYALLEAKKKLLATIPFGPLCADENLFSALIMSCFKALLEYGFKIIREDWKPLSDPLAPQNLRQPNEKEPLEKQAALQETK